MTPETSTKRNAPKSKRELDRSTKNETVPVTYVTNIVNGKEDVKDETDISILIKRDMSDSNEIARKYQLREVVSFRPWHDMAIELHLRSNAGDSLGAVANMVLRNLFSALTEAKKSLTLKENQASFLCEVEAMKHNGVNFYDIDLYGNAKGRYIRDVIEIAKENELFEKWNVDEEELIKKLENLSDFEYFAIIDAIWTFWRIVHAGVDRKNALRKVGLIRGQAVDPKWTLEAD
jgi:hypothetical protein